MPDWEKLVGEKLAGIKLEPEERREVIAELAAHLEDCHRELLEAGSPDAEGYALAQVDDWKTLRRKIVKAKEGPMMFPRAVLIPGLLCLFLTYSSLTILRHTPTPTRDPSLENAWMAYRTEMQFLLWVISLALAGGLAAWLSRRMQGSVRQRLLAATFPSVCMLGFLGITLLESLIVNPRPMLRMSAEDWSIVLVPWVLVPAMANAAGAWPFLRGNTRETTPRPADAVSA